MEKGDRERKRKEKKKKREDGIPFSMLEGLKRVKMNISRCWATEGEEEEEVREGEVKPPKRKPSEERRRVSVGPSLLPCGGSP